jgi:serine/threonine-protein kinase
MLPGMGAGPTTDVDGRHPPARPRPGVPQRVRKRRTRLVIAVILLLAVTIGAIGWWLGSGRWTTVPHLVGKPQTTAIGLLQEAGLDPVCCEKQWSEDVPSGVVISAAPAKGDAIRGSDVHLVVSQGPERFSVDAALVGQPKDAVLIRLKDLPVKVGVQEAYDDKVPAGSVTSFDPPAGTPLKRDQPVTVVVSKGHQPVAVPGVVGSTPEAAIATLQGLGFTVQRAEDGRSANVAVGQVMAVTPDPSSGPQPYGSTVTIQVSMGVPQVTVPDVTGKSRAEATAALQKLGLKVDVQTFVTGDRVWRQNPSAGSVVDQGSTVTLLLSFG